MPFDFPASPTLNDEYDTGTGIIYQFNGAAWMRLPDPPVAEYVQKTGDTMTGELVLPGVPADPLAAADKTYLDAADLLRVLKAGDTMTGPLVLSGDPTAALEAAPKQYVDNALTAVTGVYVDAAGDVMTGALVLAADPANPLEATTKQYTDAQDALNVLKGGDVMTGALSLPAPAPTDPAHATHKQYVDESIAAQSLYQGVWLPATNVPDLTPAVANPLHSYSWIAKTVDPTGTETPPAGIPGLSGIAIGSADTLIWNDTLSTYEIIRSPAAAAGFLPIAGGTMAGPILMGSGIAVQFKDTTYGISANTNLDFNIPAGVSHKFYVAGTQRLTIDSVNCHAHGGLNVGGNLSITGTVGNITSTGFGVFRNSLYLDHDTPTSRMLNFRTNGASVRWRLRNYWAQGDELQTEAFNDSGASQGIMWSVYRASGNGWLKGNLDSANVIVRSLVDEPELAAFLEGEDEPERNPLRGVNLGKALLHALREIKTLKDEIATLKGV
jgi:hypothetical protein